MKMPFRKTRDVDLVSYASLVFVVLLFFVLAPIAGEGSGSGNIFLYYASSAGQSLIGVSVLMLDFLAAFAIVLAIVSFVDNFIRLASGKSISPSLLGGTSLWGALKSVGRKLARTLLVVSPAVALVVFLSFVLSDLNVLDRHRLVDQLLSGWEQGVFGNYFFAVLGGIPWPDIVVRFVAFSFNVLSAILILSAFVIAAFRFDVLRSMIAAFCLSLCVAIPLWAAFPALSPHDRYIDNVYSLPIPAPMATSLAGYHPTEAIRNFLVNVRRNKEEVPDLPTSTMPSAHVIWTVVAGYYLWRARRWLAYVALPFLLASTLGTVLFAQHYLIDIPAGLLVAVFSIWIVNRCEAKDARRLES